jgi:Ca-activated chloride channel family protein
MAEFDLNPQDLAPLRDTQAPAPNPAVKAAAVAAALQAFRQQQNNCQASADHERIPDAAMIAAMQQPRETKMKKPSIINKMTLSLMLAGTVGLVSYVSMEQWRAHPDFVGAPVTTASLAKQAEFEQLQSSLVGESKPQQNGAAETRATDAKASAEAAKDRIDGIAAGGAALPTPMPEAVVAPSANVVAAVAEPPQRKEEEKLKPDAPAKIGNVPTIIEPPKGWATPAFIEAQQQANQQMIQRESQSGSNALPTPLPNGSNVAPSTPSLKKLSVHDFVTGGADADMAAQPGYHDFGRDKFDAIKDNPIMEVAAAPVSTFSIDVDSSSYAFTRRALNEGHLPQKDAVRVEEMINYFDYSYALPESRETPFKPSITMLPTPWNAKTMLLHVGIKGFDVPKDHRPEANLVFLIDVSGSMDEPTKLPLAKNALKMLVDTLQPTDHVAIVTYAGNAGTVLEPTAVSDKGKILQAIDNLGAGGSTAGAEGIRQAYNLAESHFVKGGVNRVMLATDGDFNVGITDQKELQSYIERERASGIFLSVLGFGTGNYNDAMMQTLAQNGNGVAAYIDNLNEARRVLVDQANSTLFPIAKDVKIQVEFNPEMVSEYRLIGYENRMLQREDFNNDKVDAGDIGSGHAVTALYEITPKNGMKMVDDLRYGKVAELDDKKIADKKSSGEYAFVKIRYKLPDGDTSKLITRPVTNNDLAGTCPPDTKCEAVQPNDDVRFTAAVAAFGQLLRGGKHTGSFGYDDVINLANGAKGKDDFGLRGEFVNLVRLAKNVPAMPQDK